MTESFLPYHEPEIVTILIQSSFLLVLNVVNSLFDKLIVCGLLGQVFVGVAWGTPGTRWLDVDFEDVVVQLGYLGLILLVYEGGLSTNFASLKANLFLSTAVAFTGIGFPMALSFVLQHLVDATPLQAFAAGAALCSTSLGTTFTILSTSGLSTTRLGTVLSSAAMMDDVIGLVMIQVISNLGESADVFTAATVVRPLAVSIGLAISVILLCRFVAHPTTMIISRLREIHPHGVLDRLCQWPYTSLIIHTLILLGSVTGATFAGTSNLFAAYLTGASISWWDSEVPHPRTERVTTRQEISSPSTEQKMDTVTVDEAPPFMAPFLGHSNNEANDTNAAHEVPIKRHVRCGEEVYREYYSAPVHRILKPFFFASIGFAIPITDMFVGHIVWKGIIYTILMLFAKLVTGLWLVRLNLSWPKLMWIKKPQISKNIKELEQNDNTHVLQNLPIESTPPMEIDVVIQAPAVETSKSTPLEPGPAPSKINKPLSLYPAAMLGTAMTARGEIGFLIAGLAETTGLFASSSPETQGGSEIYLIVTWAIVLCTIIGPLSVGTLVKRVRRLQSVRGKDSGHNGPLGIWAVEPHVR
ncbi:Sodium/hydrogen exchanger family-domain-containing protein [Bisporella sp. PMI_857]|nr:Sodium/hydrogen exchanger family-domain-containing protein [Bisporella sp. PMI_857]